MPAGDLRRAIASLEPRDVTLLCQSGELIVHVVPQTDGLCATDAGSFDRACRGRLDEAVARAVCAEHGVEWCTGQPGSWICRMVRPHESLVGAVSEVEAAFDALSMAAQACSLTAGAEDERTATRQVTP